MATDLNAYLALIERERQSRPAEAMLADEIHRLRAALYKLAEDAEVAHQGGLHNDGLEVGVDPTPVYVSDEFIDRLANTSAIEDPAQDDGRDGAE